MTTQAGARPIGAENQREMETTSGRASFPQDFPETAAGRRWANAHAKGVLCACAKRPPGKTTEKFAGSRPFSGAGELTESDQATNVLRDAVVSTLLRHPYEKLCSESRPESDHSGLAMQPASFGSGCCAWRPMFRCDRP